MKVLLPCVIAGIVALTSAHPVVRTPDEGAAELVAALRKTGDNIDPELVDRLAALATREALDGLVNVYEGLDSVYSRLLVLEAMVTLDSAEELGREAVNHISNAATFSLERELREAAVDLLGNAPNFGRAFLRLIVESSADDGVRERAMLVHVGGSTEEDLVWYQKLFDPVKTTGKKKRVRIAEGQVGKPHSVPNVRKLAFSALADTISAAKLEKALADENSDVRLCALLQMEKRGSGGVARRAQAMYDDKEALTTHRLEAARILVRVKGTSVVKGFIKDGGKASFSRGVANGVADILADWDNDNVRKQLMRIAGKGKGSKLVFSLRASRKLESDKLWKTRLKLFRSKDARVVGTLIAICADLRIEKSLEPLRDLIGRAKNPGIVRDAVSALSVLYGDDPQWIKQLLALVRGGQVGIRNAAIQALGDKRDPVYRPILEEALEHDLWSTRLVAAQALEELRMPEVIGPIAARAAKEVGRMSVELGEILWRLTGKPFGANGRRWSRWWEQEGAGFELISADALRLASLEQERRRIRETSKVKSKFFGIRIVSHSVVFVVDVSGSMDEETRGKWIGDRGEPRISVARRELTKAIESLEPSTFFNVVAFAFGVESWRKGVSPKDDVNVEEARSWISNLSAFGGTNVYGALRFAFADEDVDTVVLLSDGEPSVGAIQDPTEIRTVVEGWRRGRDVTLHCISIGGKLKLLEWLAEDSGGTYVFIP